MTSPDPDQFSKLSKQLDNKTDKLADQLQDIKQYQNQIDDKFGRFVGKSNNIDDKLDKIITLLQGLTLDARLADLRSLLLGPDTTKK